MIARKKRKYKKGYKRNGTSTQLPMVPSARERYFKRQRKERIILPCPPETLGSNLPVFSFSPHRPVIAVFPSTLGAFNLKRRVFFSLGFVSLGNSAFVAKATVLGQWNSEAESAFVLEWMKSDRRCLWSSFLTCAVETCKSLDSVSTWTCWPHKIKPAHQINFKCYNGKATLAT